MPLTPTLSLGERGLMEPLQKNTVFFLKLALKAPITFLNRNYLRFINQPLSSVVSF